MRLPKNRPPVPPGEILLEEFIKPLGLSQRKLAAALGISYQRLNEIVRGRRAITVDTALRLAKFFGTTPDVWLNLQHRVDVYNAMRHVPLENVPAYDEWKTREARKKDKVVAQ